MADAVTSNAVFSSANRYVVHLTNISDGTGESAVTKVDASALVGPDGTAPTSVTIEKVEFVCDGMQVRLLWDATTDVVAMILAGSGYFDFTEVGGLRNTKASGYTGDINLTTNAHTAGDGYSITLYCRLED